MPYEHAVVSRWVDLWHSEALPKLSNDYWGTRTRCSYLTTCRPLREAALASRLSSTQRSSVRPTRRPTRKCNDTRSGSLVNRTNVSRIAHVWVGDARYNVYM